MHRPAGGVAEHVRYNFILNTLDGAVFAFGLGFASRSAVIPVYVKHIGGDAVALSLIPVLWILGFNIPQIAIANHARQVSPKKPLLLKTGLLQRLPWLLLACAAVLLLPVLEPELAIGLFFILFTVAAVGGSLNLPVWFDLIAKITPVKMRGRLFALRTVIGAGLGILAGWIVERVLSSMAAPHSFGLLFGITFGVMMVSYVFLLLLREGDQTVRSPKIRYREYLRSLPTILRTQRNFRNFLVGEALLVSATVVEAFFAVDAIETFGLPDAYAGRFTIVVMSSMLFGTLVFGYAADRWGHRLNLILASCWMLIGCTAALFAGSVEVYYLAFVGSAFTLGLRTISRLPIVAEICGEEDRPTYVALTNVVTAPFVVIGIIGGWIAVRLGYDAVFAGAAVLSLSAAVWFGMAVREPRTSAEENRSA